jgi:hypothetical protein
MPAPHAVVKEKFGDKAKLVAELEKFTKDDDLWVSRTNADKGLKHVSNAKLVKLHRTFSEVKEKFGTRAKLIDAILEVEKRVKDDGYKSRLGHFPVPRLYDLYKSAAKRAGVGTTEGGAKKKARAEGKKTAARAESTRKKAAAANAPAKKKASSKKPSAKK